jgi:hypothetical protein
VFAEIRRGGDTMRTRKDVVVLTLAVFCLVLAMFSAIVKVEAPVELTQNTTLSFKPQSLTVTFGHTFQVQCWIGNVTNLYGVMILVGWDNTTIKYINHTVTIPVETYSSGVLHSPTLLVTDQESDKDGLSPPFPGTNYWLDESSMAPASPFSGSGTAFIMTFRAIAQAPCSTSIRFTYSILGDQGGNNINYTSKNAVVTIIGPPTILSVGFKGTSPYPYVPEPFIRPNEPIMIKANISYAYSPSATILYYSVNKGSPWTTLLNFNSTTGLWQIVIPGQQGNSTVQFYILATDIYGETTSSSTYQFNVKPLLPGDVNGDGQVNILDVIVVTSHYGSKYP